ncbi:nuclear transport factor 2 family protein [Shewanella profunda]|uniref:nuclear transport factor 2 family protein n=1 Tax=Shewanella profunda TaxID=254793 RepID=UPI0020102466|nr:nuclear transport factor 2 family protein [Shewanella profunda]MCL1091222.1 nuclear transport factor 2 family protein [Shewanella profunda]
MTQAPNIKTSASIRARVSARESTPEALVQAQLEAYNQRDLATFVAQFSDEVCIYRPPATEPVIQGKAAFSDFYQNERFNLPNLHAEIVSRMVVGNKVVDHERISGIKEHPFEVMMVFEVSDGLIQNMWSFATS